MKTIVIPDWYKVQAKLDTAPDTAFDCIISYVESDTWLFKENVAAWTLNTTDRTVVLDNWSWHNYVIWESTIYNKDTDDNTLYISIKDWDDNVYDMWKSWIKSWATIDLWNFIEADVSWTDEKVAADSWDDNPWFLSDKVDNSTIEVDTTNHDLQLKDWWVVEAKLADNAVTTAKIKDSNVTAVKLWDDIDHTKINDFDEASQDSVWWILTNTDSINLTYDDDNNKITADLNIQNSATVNTSIDSSWLKADVVANSSNQQVQIDKWWTAVWTRKEVNFIEWDNITLDISDDSDNDKVDITISSTASWWGGWIETVMIAWDQSAWTYYFELDADSDRHIWNVVIALQVANTGADFIVKCYKNWSDLSKDITIADGGLTETNGRYKASLDVNEDLVADDVFELEIYQVGSNNPWSDFSSLINIT